MRNIQNMISARSKVVGEMKRICEDAEKREDKKMTQEEANSWEKFNVEADQMEQEIKREQITQKRISESPSIDTASYLPPKVEQRTVSSFGNFLEGVAVQTGWENIRNRRTTEEYRAVTGMSEGTPADGGFLVQVEHSKELIKRTNEVGILAPKCRHIPIGADAMGITIPAIDETSRVDGSRWGGVQVIWLAEGGDKTASKIRFRQIELKLMKCAALFYATDELLQDATALESIAKEAYAQEMAYEIDRCIIRGGGVGQPQGVLNSLALITAPIQLGQLAGTLLYENVVDMWARMYGPSRARSAWYINQSIEPQLFSMALAVGFGGVPVYMPANGISGNPYGTLFGRPVIPIEQSSNLSTVGDIMLLDLNEYLIIEKGGLDSASSIHVRFTADETVFRFVQRLNGITMWNAPLTPACGGATLSPFVTLAARP